MLLSSGSAHLEAEAIAGEIFEMYSAEGHAPFPYDDCRWLRREFEEDLDGLIPDLDMWFFEIFGWSSRGERLLSLAEDDVFRARGVLSLSFYEKHPEYSWLERHIVESDTPDLFEEMCLANRLRVMLLSLFDLMLNEKFDESV